MQPLQSEVHTSCPERKAARRRSGDAGRAASSMRARRYALALQPVLTAIMKQTGHSAAIIAREMTLRGVRKPRGSAVWTPADVHKLLRRFG